MNDHVLTFVQHGKSQNREPYFPYKFSWRVPVRPLEVNQLPDGRWVHVGALARYINDHILKYEPEQRSLSDLRPVFDRIQRRSPDYSRLIPQSAALKPLLCSTIGGERELIDGACRLERLIQDADGVDTSVSMIDVPGDILEQCIVPYSTDIAPKPLRERLLHKLNQILSQNPLRRPGSPTGPHIKNFLLTNEHDQPSRLPRTEAWEHLNAVRYLVELRAIAALELKGLSQQEIFTRLNIPDDVPSRRWHWKKAAKSNPALGTPMNFKNNVKASLVQVKDRGHLDEYISQFESALEALKRAEVQAGGLSAARATLRSYTYRQDKIELDEVSKSMFGSPTTPDTHSAKISELVTVSIWTQVNAAEFYPHFQIYRTLFDMAVYFSRVMDGQKPEMTAGIAETFVDRLVMGWEDEWDHLSKHYKLIFNLIDWNSFRDIRTEAIAFLDRQSSREVFRVI